MTRTLRIAAVRQQPLVAAPAPLVFTGGADAAQSMLSVLVGSIVTVAGTVFSVTVVALQLASAQYSPRLLRNFLRDRGTQATLSTFLATLAYMLSLLLQLGALPTEEQVPALAVSGALVLTLGSVGALVFFIHDVTKGIRVESIMLSVRETTARALSQLPSEGQGRLPPMPAYAATIPGSGSGYLQAIDREALRDLAVEHGLALRLRRSTRLTIG